MDSVDVIIGEVGAVASPWLEVEFAVAVTVVAVAAAVYPLSRVVMDSMTAGSVDTKRRGKLSCASVGAKADEDREEKNRLPTCTK